MWVKQALCFAIASRQRGVGFESSIGSFIILFHITAAKSKPAVRSLGRIAYHHKAKTLLRHGIPQFAENHNYTCIRERTLPELIFE
uniref:Similarity n=1 Tax=Microcystis aeruginosa (strain PCC 7806) TaxID=267872 RepID=A8YD98_MICA7|nr:unnamed protein product [Microcystis aeruginosa PCC 7806]